MDRNQTQPLDCEQAKARLREAAKRASPTSYVLNHPTHSLVIALASGYFAARFRMPKILTIVLAEQLLPFLISQTFRSRRASRSRHK